MAGGCAQPCDINETDKHIIQRLKPELKKLGLMFVGIDILGDKLIEVNVTSPTCLQEMSQHAGKNLAIDVIQHMTDKIHAKKEIHAPKS